MLPNSHNIKHFGGWEEDGEGKEGKCGGRKGGRGRKRGRRVKNEGKKRTRKVGI